MVCFFLSVLRPRGRRWDGFGWGGVCGGARGARSRARSASESSRVRPPPSRAVAASGHGAHSWCVLPVVVQANGRLSGEDSWTDGTERLRSARGQRFSVGAGAAAWLFLRNFASAATHPAVARAVSHTEQQICERPAWSRLSRADTKKPSANFASLARSTARALHS